MKLENLLNQIEKEYKEEMSLLEKESDLALSEIDKKGEEKIVLLQKEKEAELLKEKEKMLSNFLKEKKFQAEMEILNLKYELIRKAANQAKEAVKNLSDSEKKEILKREMEKIRGIIKGNASAFVPIGRKGFFADLLKEIPAEKIVEKELGFEYGLIVESEKFIFKVDLLELIDEKINEISLFCFLA